MRLNTSKPFAGEHTMTDPDFEKMLFKGYSLVTINVIYFLPDHRSLVNEFMWQTCDLSPKYPRVKKFLDFWQREIDAVIKEVQLSDSIGLKPRYFRKVEEITGLLH
jgi:uncharacterized protein Usg